MDKFFKHGGYRNLKSFQASEIIFDYTFEFCKKYIRPGSRTVDQMEQAARSGKQNISEGSQTSAVLPKSEIMLINVARASLEELKNDYEDFLRLNNLKQWDKNDFRAVAIRNLAYKSDKSYMTYRTYLSEPEAAANCALCLINQANYLLDRQLRAIREQRERQGIQFESRDQKAARIFYGQHKQERELNQWIKGFLKNPQKGL